MLIEIFTDGSAVPRNPGHGGAAGVILYGDSLIAVADYVGHRITSNQAELHAIKRALETYIEIVGDLDNDIVLYSDSYYSLNVVSGQYKARKNSSLVKDILKSRNMLSNLKLFWIRAHRKETETKKEETKKIIKWNSIVDNIAGKAARRGKGYSYQDSMPIDKFIEKITKIQKA